MGQAQPPQDGRSTCPGLASVALALEGRCRRGRGPRGARAPLPQQPCPPAGAQDGASSLQGPLPVWWGLWGEWGHLLGVLRASSQESVAVSVTPPPAPLPGPGLSLPPPGPLHPPKWGWAGAPPPSPSAPHRILHEKLQAQPLQASVQVRGGFLVLPPAVLQALEWGQDTGWAGRGGSFSPERSWLASMAAAPSAREGPLAWAGPRTPLEPPILQLQALALPQGPGDLVWVWKGVQLDQPLGGCRARGGELAGGAQRLLPLPASCPPTLTPHPTIHSPGSRLPCPSAHTCARLHSPPHVCSCLTSQPRTCPVRRGRPGWWLCEWTQGEHGQ